MNRRNFLKTGGALSIPALLQSGIAANPLELFSQFINPDSDRVLVLIRLSGGNDGLNSLIGIDQLDNLSQVRPNVALPDTGYVNLTTLTGLHKSMIGMKELFDNGKLGAIQAVGYPNQNRSHFRSTDIWTSASDAETVITTGWLGRYLDGDHPEYPTGYPNEDFESPLAMTMGNVVSETCQGIATNFSVSVNNPFNYQYIAPGGNTPLPSNYYGDELGFVRTLIGQSNQYGSVVQNAANAGASLASNYTSGSLSKQLRDIAYLISGGLETKIFVATLGGFDTHANQVSGDNSTGTHADLMTELSDSIKAFMDDLELLGLQQRVLGLTFSEFGRRIRSNVSNGTDHGDAGPLFLFGDCVETGVLGENPIIDTAVSQGTGVPYQYDFRDIYGSVLVDWFDVPQATVQNLVSGGFTYLPIASSCNLPLPADHLNMIATGYDDEIKVFWNTNGNDDHRGGFLIERSEDGRNFRTIGQQAAFRDDFSREYEHVDRNVRPGITYYYRIRVEDGDGAFDYTSVQTARLKGTRNGEWAVSLPRPNPVNETSFIKVNAPMDGDVSCDILDSSGRRIRASQHFLVAGIDTQIALQPAGLPAGSYVWRLRSSDGHQFSRKFVK